MQFKGEMTNMRMTRRNASAIAALAFLALAVSGCTQAETEAPETNSAEAAVAAPSNLVAADKLTYGVAASFAPFEYKTPSGEITGFDVEMGAALAESMGLEVAPLDMDFAGLIPALTGNRVDIINSAMYINAEREAQVDFVPYMQIGEAILVPEGNPLDISDLDDLSGKTVAVNQGAISEIGVTKHNVTLKDRDMPEIEMLILTSSDQTLQAVLNGRADAMLTSTPGAAEIQTQVPGEVTLAGTYANDTLIGIAVRKGDSEMKGAMTAALEHIRDNGALATIAEKYNMPVEGLEFDASE